MSVFVCFKNFDPNPFWKSEKKKSENKNSENPTMLESQNAKKKKNNIHMD
jgi:hypothetical protein